MDSSYQNFIQNTDDFEDTPHDRVKIHVPASSRVTRWSHIENLDLFFTRLYNYHQKHGFFCILLGGILELVKVLFMLVFCVFLLYFVDYEVLFHNKLPKNNIANSTISHQKITVDDVICSFDDCFGNISGLTWICIGVVLLYWFFRLIKLAYNLYNFWDIKGFFNIALQISDEDLVNITWHEVQKKICEVQIEHKMCIRKKELTQLDIYHRILRSKNYMVAMINKSILPIYHNLPFFGRIAYMSQGLKYNVELLLFSGTWGFFENWNLKEDYKRQAKRLELAAKLQRNITYFAIINLISGVFIFLWQLVYFFFNYAELLKREPGVLALRCWSLYGRQYLRHFNELDHELEARLRRAYRPAAKYANTFSSPVMIIISQFMVFTAGSVLVVLTALAIYDEDVLTVEHMLTIMAVLGGIIAIFRGILPDENLCWCPETLMIEILAEVHYLPDSWRGQAHTTFVRDQFSQFFQYKATYLLFELLSPVVTPLIFYFKLRPRSLDIIDFYRNFTVNVVGVGDVCSFSLLDMRRHGNPAWHPHNRDFLNNNRDRQAEDGKTELSLMHFAAMNPTWQPPKDAEGFISEIKEKARHHGDQEAESDRYSEIVESTSPCASVTSSHVATSPQPQASTSRMNPVRGYRTEDSMASSSYYFNPAFGNNDSMYSHTANDRPLVATGEDPVVDMNLGTLYLHSLHHKMLTSEEHSSNFGADECNVNAYSPPSSSSKLFKWNNDNDSEGTPLLKNSK